MKVPTRKVRYRNAGNLGPSKNDTDAYVKVNGSTYACTGINKADAFKGLKRYLEEKSVACKLVR